jgi:hypothetical protein
MSLRCSQESAIQAFCRLIAALSLSPVSAVIRSPVRKVSSAFDFSDGDGQMRVAARTARVRSPSGKLFDANPSVHQALVQPSVESSDAPGPAQLAGCDDGEMSQVKLLPIKAEPSRIGIHDVSIQHKVDIQRCAVRLVHILGARCHPDVTSEHKSSHLTTVAVSSTQSTTASAVIEDAHKPLYGLDERKFHGYKMITLRSALRAVRTVAHVPLRNTSLRWAGVAIRIADS